MQEASSFHGLPGFEFGFEAGGCDGGSDFEGGDGAVEHLDCDLHC